MARFLKRQYDSHEVTALRLLQPLGQHARRYKHDDHTTTLSFSAENIYFEPNLSFDRWPWCRETQGAYKIPTTVLYTDSCAMIVLLHYNCLSVCLSVPLKKNTRTMIYIKRAQNKSKIKTTRHTALNGITNKDTNGQLRQATRSVVKRESQLAITTTNPTKHKNVGPETNPQPLDAHPFFCIPLPPEIKRLYQRAYHSQYCITVCTTVQTQACCRRQPVTTL